MKQNDNLPLNEDSEILDIRISSGKTKKRLLSKKRKKNTNED